MLQAFLSSLPRVEPQHILPLCPHQRDGSRPTRFSGITALHGLGHGLTIQFRYDVLKSLAFCDALAGELGSGVLLWRGVHGKHRDLPAGATGATGWRAIITMRRPVF